MWRLPIQNYPKLFITEKGRNKAKYVTWNFIKLSLKKTSMSKLVKSIGYIKCYNSSNSKPVKSLSNSIGFNYQTICSWLRRPKTILEIGKKATFLLVINTPFIYKFCKDFNNHKTKTNRAVVFSCRPGP